MRDLIFTSESVTPGHPDKLCDQISDAAIDAYLRQDVQARAIVECAVATGVVFIAARYVGKVDVDLSALARGVIADAGYRGSNDGFDARTCSILTSITELPIAGKRARAATADGSQPDDLVAFEQANAFGFACDETPERMPAPIMLAHRLSRALAAAREDGLAPWLAPDGKTQVSVQYRDGTPARIRGISLTTAIDDDAPSPAQQTKQLREIVTVRAFQDAPLHPDSETVWFVNPAGSAGAGGPATHAGLTGRKNGIDTYGEYARQSGSALSGKDPSRIDRVGAYAARYAARNIVAAGLATRCEVHVAYAIGAAQPVSLTVQTFGTGRIPEEEIERRLISAFDFGPGAIMRRFDLQRAPAKRGAGGFFRPLAVFGQIGRADLDLPWEKEDLADALAG